MTTPSIELFPSGYKATKLYSQLPKDGIGDFTFARSTTATRINSDKLIETVAIDVPRLDYSDDVCPVLLTEPQSTNLLLRSEEFDNASWSKIQTGSASIPVVTSNRAISPDGTLTADRIVFATNGLTSGDRSILRQSISTSAVDYNISIYLKVFSGANQQIAFHASGFAFSNITVTNQWIRYDLTSVAGTPTSFWGLELKGSLGVEDCDILVWASQLEELDYSTSYIETISSTVTRTADIVNNSGDSSIFNSSEGVLYAELAALSDDLTHRTISINDGTSDNIVIIRLNITSKTIDAGLFISTISQANISTVVSNTTQLHKIAFKYKQNDFALWIDGVEVGTDVLGNTFSSGVLLNLSFDVGDGSQDFYGKLKELKVFKTALTDSELITLTT